MNNESRINNYFDKVKQNPPLIPIEKVHQIISRPDAMARLKGKTNNLLKFTIMTSIIAFIITAVMLWPTQNEKSQIPKEQIPAQTQTVSTAVVKSNTKVNSLKQSQSSSAETSAEKQNISDAKPQNEIENNMSVPLAKEAKTYEDRDQKVNIDSIQPVDRSKFILRLSNEELEKIGFQITDSSVIFKNSSPIGSIDIDYNCFAKNYSMGKKAAPKANPLKENTFHSFYPVVETDLWFREDGFSYIKQGTFESNNDTLLPIQIPLNELFGDQYPDRILWFNVTRELIQLLPLNYHPIANQIMELKKIKRLVNNGNLVNYLPKSLFYDIRFINLSEAELKKFGFSFDKEVKCEIKYDDYSFYFIADSRGIYSYSNGIIPEWDKNIVLPSFISDTLGSFLPIEKSTAEVFKENAFNRFIPIRINLNRIAPNFSILYWYTPTDAFFNALPERISKDLRKEYNYITAEDKSTLEKPECKYFDECKNTLKVSRFKVFPNPANDRITVTFTLPGAITGKISLVDLAGHEQKILQPKTSFSKGTQQLEFSINEVPEGIYLLLLYADEGIQTQRIIVTR
jgi:hypothetical protein